MALLMATLHAVATFCPTFAGGPSNDLPDLSLTEALCAGPRVVGTQGYERGLGLIEERLRAAGLPVERIETTAVRAVPRRSDALLFEGPAAEFAFAGLRERWEPDAPRPMGPPAAYPFNVESADLRAPVVDLGAGLPEDYGRLADQRVDVRGAVALVGWDPVPARRAASLRELTEMASRAGCVAVLVAPTGVEQAAGGAMPLCRRHLGDRGELALPAVPVRGIEAEAIRARLRARRVRGEDGEATTVKVGPGPVEARVVVECPREVLRGVPALRVPGQGSGAAGPPLLVRADESLSLLGDALAVDLALAAAAGIEGGASRRDLHFAPIPAEFDSSLDVVEGLLEAAAGGALNPGVLPRNGLESMGIPGDPAPGDTRREGGAPALVAEVVYLASPAPFPTTLGRDPGAVLPPLGDDFPAWAATARDWVALRLSSRVPGPQPGEGALGGAPSPADR